MERTDHGNPIKFKDITRTDDCVREELPMIQDACTQLIRLLIRHQRLLEGEALDVCSVTSLLYLTGNAAFRALKNARRQTTHG